MNKVKLLLIIFTSAAYMNIYSQVVIEDINHTSGEQVYIYNNSIEVGPNAVLSNTAKVSFISSKKITLKNGFRSGSFSAGAWAKLSYLKNIYTPSIIANIDKDCALSAGLISLEVSNGKAPYSFEWDDGSHMSQRGFTGVGDYSVTVTDGNGITCSEIVNVSSDVYTKPIWISVIGCMHSEDGFLIKEADNGWGNAEAISSNYFTDDGTLDYLISEEGYDSRYSNYSLSLRCENKNEAYTYLFEFGQVSIMENDSVIVDSIDYKIGDRFIISRQGGSIKYFQNNIELRSTPASENDILFAKASIYSKGFELSNVKLSFTASNNCQPLENISLNTSHIDAYGLGSVEILTNNVEGDLNYILYKGDSLIDSLKTNKFLDLYQGDYTVTVKDQTGNQLEKDFMIGEVINWSTSSGTVISDNLASKTANIGWDTGVSIGENTLDANGDGEILFNVPEETIKISLGFRDFNNNSEGGLSGLDYGFVLNEGILEIYENGVKQQTVGTYKGGDQLIISRDGDNISYVQNSNIISSETVSALGALALSPHICINEIESALQMPVLISKRSYYPNIEVKDYYGHECKTVSIGEVLVEVGLHSANLQLNYRMINLSGGVETIVPYWALDETSHTLGHGLYKLEAFSTNSIEFEREVFFAVGRLFDNGFNTNFDLITPDPSSINITGANNELFTGTAYFAYMKSLELKPFEDGFFTFKIADLDHDIRMEFREINTSGNQMSSQLLITYSNQNLKIFAQSVEQTGLGLEAAIGDLIFVERKGSEFYLYINGELILTKSTDPSKRLFFDARLDNGASVRDVMLSFCNSEHCESLANPGSLEVSEYLLPDAQLVYDVCAGQTLDLDLFSVIPVEVHSLLWSPTEGIDGYTGVQSPPIIVQGGTTIYTLEANMGEEGSTDLPCTSYLQIEVNGGSCEEIEDGFSFNNYGAYIGIKENTNLNVYGSILNENSGFSEQTKGEWENKGVINFTKNWTNNANNNVFINSSNGFTNAIGEKQYIKGVYTTEFENLSLEITGKKIMLVDTWIKNTLDLVDSELDTRDYTLWVKNRSVDAIDRSDGYVLTHTKNPLQEYQGWLKRSQNINHDYFYPVAGRNLEFSDPQSQLLYRPLSLAGKSTYNYFDVACINDDVGIRESSNLEPNVTFLNTKFYHLINADFSDGTAIENPHGLEVTQPEIPLAPGQVPNLGIYSPLCDITSYYYENLDGDYSILTHLDNEEALYPDNNGIIPVWESCINLSKGSDVMDWVKTNDWEDFSSNNFSLGKAGIVINTDNFGDQGDTFTVGDDDDGDTSNDGPINPTGTDVVFVPDNFPNLTGSGDIIINTDGDEESNESNIIVTVDNSLQITGVSIDFDTDYPLSDDLYDIIDGYVLILYSEPKDLGPVCVSNIEILLNNGLELNPGLGSNFNSFSINTSYNTVVQAGLKLSSFDGTITYYDSSTSPVNITPDLDINNEAVQKTTVLIDQAELSSIFTADEQLLKFELTIGSTVLKGQFISKIIIDQE